MCACVDSIELTRLFDNARNVEMVEVYVVRIFVLVNFLKLCWVF